MLTFLAMRAFRGFELGVAFLLAFALWCYIFVLITVVYLGVCELGLFLFVVLHTGTATALDNLITRQR